MIATLSTYDAWKTATDIELSELVEIDDPCERCGFDRTTCGCEGVYTCASCGALVDDDTGECPQGCYAETSETDADFADAVSNVTTD